MIVSATFSPTATTTPTATLPDVVKIFKAMRDTRVDNVNTSYNYGHCDVVDIGGSIDYASFRPGFIYFDTSSIPVGATLTSATLYLTYTSFQHLSGGVLVRALAADWIEGNKCGATASGEATYLHSGYTAWAQEGGYTGTSPNIFVQAPPASDQTNQNVTITAGNMTPIQGWLNTPASNFGFKIMCMLTSATPAYISIKTRENADLSSQPNFFCDKDSKERIGVVYKPAS